MLGINGQYIVVLSVGHSTNTL